MNAVPDGAGAGATYVQDCVSVGVPEHPLGDEDSTVRVCVLLV